MKTADPELMRAINRFHVLDTIRRHGPLARVAISERTELSPTTISAITGSLIESGFIEPVSVGDLRNSGTGGRGRPRVMLQLKADAACVIGVKVSPYRMHFVLTDFQGDVLSEFSLPVRLTREPVDVLAYLIADGVRSCLIDAGRTLDEIDSLSIAMPGVIEHATGSVRESPLLGQSNAPLAAALQDRLGILTFLESDADAIAQGERWFGKARDLDDFVLVSLEHSIGLSIMNKGQLFRGATGLSPNLGDLVISAPDAPVLIRLSELAEQSAIIAGHARTDFARDNFLSGTPDTIIPRIQTGDLVLIENAGRAGESLGTALANIITLLAPPRILLVGSVLGLGEHLLEPLRRAMKAAVPPALADLGNVDIHHADDGLWARGAAALALRELYGSPWGTMRPKQSNSRSDQEGVKHVG
ncbi:ROK family transcriptional regulator [Roseinatronobacter sp. S2]|uniref:ROK family transcriptional regulator n=1 Tax=Roseinatronobacter sp. S2 TaxID=3035471 RepID=UPI00240EB837|nr:ROK family transcriptional regulator [Roseinatronobacter sp. S2]WFE77017.1 ROK family transcriptional regulator [Roseinatronobacter sp. S2]